MSCPGRKLPLWLLRELPKRGNREALWERLKILPHPSAGKAWVTHVTPQGPLWISEEREEIRASMSSTVKQEGTPRSTLPLMSLMCLSALRNTPLNSSFLLLNFLLKPSVKDFNYFLLSCRKKGVWSKPASEVAGDAEAKMRVGKGASTALKLETCANLAELGYQWGRDARNVMGQQ